LLFHQFLWYIKTVLGEAATKVNLKFLVYNAKCPKKKIGYRATESLSFTVPGFFIFQGGTTMIKSQTIIEYVLLTALAITSLVAAIGFINNLTKNGGGFKQHFDLVRSSIVSGAPGPVSTVK
jgi:hypothetical protein